MSRRRTAQRCNTTTVMQTARRTTLVAEASPGLPPISAVKRSNAVVASNLTLPPTMEGVPKSAIDSTKASSAPLLTAGKTSGSVTLKNRRHGPAPRLSAASSTEGLIEPKLLAVSKKTKG
jgi:hypothetical protein